MKVEGVQARMILDSRGTPTVEAEVRVTGDGVGRASVPSGASTGTHESLELRDGDPCRWQGRGVERAVGGIRETIAPALQGMQVIDQAAVDRALVELDGTDDRRRLGANALLAVSVACARAAAAGRGVPLWQHLSNGTPVLPLPMVNMVSGNLHAGGGMDVQDVLAVPHAAQDYPTALRVAVGIYRRVGALLRQRGMPALVGDEGGYGLVEGSSETGIALVAEALVAEGLEPGVDASIALDIAATHLAYRGRYRLDGSELTVEAFADRLAGWCARYAVCSIEDPFHEDAWDLWTDLMRRTAGSDLQVLGDDLIVTHRARLETAIARHAANAVLVKPNQIGTLSEALDLARQAADNGLRVVVSARSGETEDDWLADVAVASGAGQIKVGSVVRSERLAKYNRLLRIAEAHPELPYAGGGQTLPRPKLSA